jgi:hypothetical protein
MESGRLDNPKSAWVSANGDAILAELLRTVVGALQTITS